MSLEEKQSKSIVTYQGYSKDEIDLLKNTIAKGATDDELKMFLYLAKQYELDPFKREIFFIKYRGRNGVDSVTIQTSRDGYLKIAMKDPDYAGLQSFVVCEGDTFKINAGTDAVFHEFGAKRGKILGAWAIAYHKKRRPFICFVPFDEYVDYSKDTWKKYPSAMIQKVAESFTLKRQFNINGLVTQEEMGMDDVNSTANIMINEKNEETIPAISEPLVEEIEPEQDVVDRILNDIKAKVKKAKMNQDQMNKSLEVVTGYCSLVEAVEQDAIEALELFDVHLENIIELFGIIKDKKINKDVLATKVTKKSYEMDFGEIEDLLYWAKNYEADVENKTEGEES